MDSGALGSLACKPGALISSRGAPFFFEPFLNPPLPIDAGVAISSSIGTRASKFDGPVLGSSS